MHQFFYFKKLQWTNQDLFLHLWKNPKVHHLSILLGNLHIHSRKHKFMLGVRQKQIGGRKLVIGDASNVNLLIRQFMIACRFISMFPLNQLNCLWRVFLYILFGKGRCGCNTKTINYGMERMDVLLLKMEGTFQFGGSKMLSGFFHM